MSCEDNEIISDCDPHETVSGLVDAAYEIVTQRRELKRQLREALLRNNNQEALRLSRVLCGLENETSDRTDQGVH